MAKARGNKLVPPANFSRNPMQGWADQERAVTGGILSLRPGQAGQNWRQAQRDWAALEQGATRGWGEQPNTNAPMQLLGGAPRSFNPANQDVLNRAAAALNAIQQDRQNPMSYGRPMLPMSVASQPNRFVGPSAQQIAFNGPNTPAIRNPINQELAPVRDPQAAAMDALRARIDAMTQQSQQANPMAPPAPAYNPMQAEIDRGTRQGNIMMTPGAGSSLEATRNFRKIQPDTFNGTTAGTVNGYNGQMDYATNPMRRNTETMFNFAKANAQRIAGGGAAADPTNMAGRFGGAYGNNLNADATAIQEGRAVRTADGNVVYHTGTPESARRAQLRGKSEREALRDRSRPAATPEEAERRRLADKRKAENAARHQAFKDANGGMNYRQYDRMQASNALTMKAVDEGRLSPEAAMFRMQTRADKALRRAGNPMAMSVANGGRLFPDLLAGRGGRGSAAPQNPMAAVSETFKPGGVVTPDGRANAKTFLKAAFSGGQDASGKPIAASAFLAGTGATGEEDNVQDLHFGIQQQVQSGVEPSTQDLQTLYGVVSALDSAYTTPEYDPFDMTYGSESEGMFGSVDTEHTQVFSPMYKELAGMKNPTPQSLRSWWKTFRSRIRPDTNRFIGGSSILSGEGRPTVSPGGYEYPLPQNPMK